MAKTDNTASEKTRDIPTLDLPEEDIKAVSEDYAPDGYDSQKDYLDDLRETYELDLEADDDNRKAAMEDKKFVAGEQWDPIVLQCYSPRKQVSKGFDHSCRSMRKRSAASRTWRALP